jgi:hypothetical protein
MMEVAMNTSSVLLPGVRRRRVPLGMTLIEMLVTFALLIVSGVWAMGSYHGILHLTEVAGQSTLAINHLKDMMEAIEATPFSQLAADFPHDTTGGSGGTAYAAIVGNAPQDRLPDEAVVVRHRPNASANPRELEVEVRWTNRERVYTRTLSTIRTDQTS